MILPVLPELKKTYFKDIVFKILLDLDGRFYAIDLSRMPVTYVANYKDEFLNETISGTQTYLKFINEDKIEFMYGGIEFALLRDKQHYAVVTFKYMFEHDRFPVEISIYEHNKKGSDTLLAFADKQCLSQIQFRP